MFDVGDEVGDYEIVARIKSGGMATLFLARRRGASGFAKHVAIKVVHPHLAEDPQFVRMFVDEALLSAKIHHPNVVHVEELREVDGQHFLVMEYVDGCSLAQLMRELAKRQRRLTPTLASHIAVCIADGLHAAHELKEGDGTSLGVVHRDVSPQNVLLAWQGHVKLIDFGVAKARTRSQQTVGTSLKGKVRYMAPEQAFGRSIDRRADVYALGIVLWEMLTMRRCFDAEDELALLEQVRKPEIPPPSTLVPEIPRQVDAVVMRALATNPEARYPTAQRLRRDLAQALPAAMALDASHLSELLTAIMAEQAEKTRRILPNSFARHDAAPAAEAFDGSDEALKTLTISQTGPASFMDFPSGDGGPGRIASGSAAPSAPPASSTPSSSPPSTSGGSDAGRAPEGGAAPSSTPAPPVQAAGTPVAQDPIPERPSRAPVILVVGALAGLLAFAGVGLVLTSGREDAAPAAVVPSGSAGQPSSAGDADGIDDDDDAPRAAAAPSEIAAPDAAVASAADAEDSSEPQPGGPETEETTDATAATHTDDAPEAATERTTTEEPAARRRRRRAIQPRPTRMESAAAMEDPGVPLADDFGF